MVVRPGDIPIPDYERLGLIIPSKVRTAKLATVVASDATSLGRLDKATWTVVRGLVLHALE